MHVRACVHTHTNSKESFEPLNTMGMTNYEGFTSADTHI